MYDVSMAGRPPLSQAPECGARLAALRTAAGLSQAQLADSIGVPVRSITFYERKAKSIPSHLIVKLAKALNTSPDEVLGLEPIEKKARRGPKSEIEKRIEDVRKLPKSAQKRILSVVDAMLAQEAKAS